MVRQAHHERDNIDGSCRGGSRTAPTAVRPEPVEGRSAIFSHTLREHFEDPTVVTTVGDLVAAVMDASLEVVDDEKESYRIAGLVLNNMLRLTSSHSFLLDGRNAGRLVREA